MTSGISDTILTPLSIKIRLFLLRASQPMLISLRH